MIYKRCGGRGKEMKIVRSEQKYLLRRKMALR